VLLLPSRAGARAGVAVVMLTAPGASAQVSSPMEVGATGVLLKPLKTFSFG
jgi:AmiR/NasT family two-component response regulator